MANVVDVSQLLLDHPLALRDARFLYPSIKLSDVEFLSAALGFATEIMGMVDVRMFLKRFPEMFVFSTLCCWAYYQHQLEHKSQDVYYAQRQYNTMINTLLSVGHSEAECVQVIESLSVPAHAKPLLLRDLKAWIEEKDLVVYPLNANAQGATVH